MKLKMTRRRFLVLLSSAFAFLRMPRSTFGSEQPKRSDVLKAPANDVLIWFDSSASEWAEALPVGNGRLGGMVFGGVLQERIGLNEDTLWSGYPKDWNSPNARGHLSVVRDLVLNKKDYKSADEECRWMQGPYNQAYEPLGDLVIDFEHGTEASEYRRELNLDEAVASVSYKVDGVKYRRDVFASATAQVVVVRVTCSKPGGLSGKIALTSALRCEVSSSQDRQVWLQGKAPSESAPNYLFTRSSGQRGWVPSSVSEGADKKIKEDTATAPSREPEMTAEEARAQVAADLLAAHPIQYSDQAGKGMHFGAVLNAASSDGLIEPTVDGGLSFRHATELVLLVGMATGYKGYAVQPDTPADQVLALAAASVKLADTEGAHAGKADDKLPD